MYGTGLALTIIGRESGPLALTIRPMTRPVTGEPSRFLRDRHDHVVVVVAGNRVAGIVALPSAAQADVTEQRARASPIVIRPPRFGTSCHIRWLLFDMSIGLTRKKLATYSTLPFAFLRRQLDVGDDRVVRIVRIELAEGAARERFVLAGAAEGPAVEGGRHLLVDDDSFDLGLCRRGDRRDREKATPTNQAKRKTRGDVMRDLLEWAKS